MKFNQMKDTDQVTVCDSCLRASCVQGVSLCEEWRHAGTIEMTVKELKKLNLEPSDFWIHDLAMKD